MTKFLEGVPERKKSMEKRFDAFSRFCLSLLIFSFLAGCAPLPPLNFSLVNASPSPDVINYNLKSTVVTLAAPSEQTGDIPPQASDAVPIWQAALEDATNRSAIFEDSAPTSVDLECKILKIDVAAFGLAMTSDVAARYQVIDRSSGLLVFDQVIDTPGTVPMSYSMIGVIRSRESVNVAAQNNIGAFILALEQSKLARPRSKSLSPALDTN